MNGLYLDLPPFSPDTSGFAAVLTGSDGAGFLDDVRGAAGNYYGWEECRQDVEVRAFVSQLCNTDAVFGSDEVVFRRFLDVSQALAPRFAVFTAAPVGSLIGTDAEHLSRRAREERGIPACSVTLSGMDTYDVGVSRTLCALAEAFSREGEGGQNGLNLLGANSLDWSEADLDGVRQWAEQAIGETVHTVFGGRFTYEELCRLSRARLNWVVNVAGLRSAKLLKKRFGTPYVCGAPFGAQTAAKLLAEIAGKAAGPAAPRPRERTEAILIVGEQFASNALRDTLQSAYGCQQVTVGSFFMLEPSLARPGDLSFRQEDDFARQCGGYDIIVGDPLLRRCVSGGGRFVPLPHAPVSAKLYADQRPALLGRAANHWIEAEIFQAPS